MTMNGQKHRTPNYLLHEETKHSLLEDVGDLKMNFGVEIYSAFQSLPTLTHGENQHNLPTHSYHAEWTQALEQQRPKVHLIICCLTRALVSQALCVCIPAGNYSRSGQQNKSKKRQKVKGKLVSTNHWLPFGWWSLFLKHLTFFSLIFFFFSFSPPNYQHTEGRVKLRSSQTRKAILP